MKVLLCYFSATGNTAKVADTVAGRLTERGAAVETRDITALKDREAALDTAAYDAVIFGSPIHSMRAPRLVREWLDRLDGQGRKCALFLTYGSFQVHPAHYTTCEILKKRNFQVVASAEFLGAHTFNIGGWKAGTNRPDDHDLAVAREYADTVYRRFTGEDPGLIGDLDQGPYTENQLDQFEEYRCSKCDGLISIHNGKCFKCDTITRLVEKHNKKY